MKASPGQSKERAEAIACALQTLPGGERASALNKIKAQDPILHALIVQTLSAWAASSNRPTQ